MVIGNWHAPEFGMECITCQGKSNFNHGTGSNDSASGRLAAGPHVQHQFDHSFSQCDTMLTSHQFINTCVAVGKSSPVSQVFRTGVGQSCPLQTCSPSVSKIQRVWRTWTFSPVFFIFLNVELYGPFLLPLWWLINRSNRIAEIIPHVLLSAFDEINEIHL